MLNNWKKDKLGNLCYRIGDGLHGTPDYVDDSDIFFINGNNLKDGKILISEDTKKVSEKTLVDNQKDLSKNSLLLSINGTIGNLAFYKGEKIMLGKSASYLNFKTEINNFYYYYLQLKGVQDYLYNIATGSTIKNLGLKSINELEVPVPKENEWKSITKVLSDLDAKIEVNKKINQQLEAMAKTLYDYWFVQFDFPDINGKPYKSSGGKMVYNEVLKREIPERWVVSELKDLISSNRGVSYSGKDIEGNGVPMINLNSFNTDSSYKSEGIKYFSGSYIKSKVLKPLDLVMCNTQQTAINPKTDIIGKSFLVPDIFGGEIVSSHHITTIKVQKEDLKYYLNALFNTEYFHRYISGYATGTNILGLHFSGVSTYKTEIPDDALLKKFALLIENIENRKSTTIKQNQKLSALRDWLLPMLMNGQVTVGEKQTKTYANSEILSIAAEENVSYQNFKDIFDSISYDYEVATIVWLTQSELRLNYGKKYIHKTYSNMQLLNLLPEIKQPVFKEHYWGMFSDGLRETIDYKKFICFKTLENGRQVVEFNYKHLSNVSNWTKEEGYNKDFTNEVRNMIAIYQKPLIDKDMDRIELLNTVLQCITALNSYEFDQIWDKMKTWEMKEGNYKTKADKFTEYETKLMIDLIKELK